MTISHKKKKQTNKKPPQRKVIHIRSCASIQTCSSKFEILLFRLSCLDCAGRNPRAELNWTTGTMQPGRYVAFLTQNGVSALWCPPVPKHTSFFCSFFTSWLDQWNRWLLQVTTNYVVIIMCLYYQSRNWDNTDYTTDSTTYTRDRPAYI